MKLRFRVLKPANNIHPDDFQCGAVYNTIPLNSFALLIAVNGTTIFNLEGGLLNSGTNLTAPAGALTATLSVENDYYIKFGLNLANRDDSANIRIRIIENESTTFDTTFPVFGWDLGKNPNIVLPDGMANFVKPFDIKLVPRVWELPEILNRDVVCASAFVYRDFNPKDIHIIQNASSIAIAEYSLVEGGPVIASGKYVKIENPKNGISKLFMKVTNPGTGVVSVIEVDVPSAPVTDPALGFTIVNAGCDTCQCLNETTTIGLTTNKGVIDAYLADDVKFLENLVLNNNLELINMVTGETIHVQNYSYAPNPDISIINHSYIPPGGLDLIAQHKLIFTVRKTDEDGEVLASIEILLNPCSEEEILRIDCNKYTWKNSGVTATLKLYSIDQNGTETLVNTYSDIEVGVTQEIILNDGVYIMRVEKNGEVVYSYKLVGICALVNCIKANALKVACFDPCEEKDCGCPGDCGDCADCSKSSLEMFNTLVVTYISLLNKLTIENPIFIELDTQSASTLKELALIQDRISKHCLGCL